MSQFSAAELGFATLSAWRIITKYKMIFGCYDDKSKEEIQKLQGLNIIDVETQKS